MSEEGAGGGARRSGGFSSPVPSLEQMLAANPGKTPISLLQEYGTRIGKTPGYDLLKAEGQAHQPNFTFRVTVGDISCTGAQQESGEAQSGRGGPEAAQRGGHAGAHHPRGAQELVVQKGWRLPEYTVTQESGPAHRKEFTMTCRVERFVEIGSGTSKKLAKRNAAAKMLVRIHNVPMEPREGSEAEVEEDQFSMAGPRLEGLRGRAPGCTWDSLRNSAGEKIVQLRSHPLAPMGAGACALLQELSEEQSFAISYLDIDTPTDPRTVPWTRLPTHGPQEGFWDPPTDTQTDPSPTDAPCGHPDLRTDRRTDRQTAAPRRSPARAQGLGGTLRPGPPKGEEGPWAPTSPWE
ncbi:RISC-loading complex subunit TARBP2 isoform X3 [Grus americana]|uniref:RISC-loading complex subunit TARBP2 isoform X3 n=1 Tax=Grus americana TaxID=9117 RepID=UPI0024087979|nr:RISC-loading complex subunit TARBP2 isoform X3 [Grus americana]